MGKLLRMFSFVRPYKWRLFFFYFAVIGYSFFRSVPILIIRQYLKVIFDARQVAGDANTEAFLGQLWHAVFLLVSCLILGAYFMHRCRIAQAYLSAIAVRDATNRVLRHLLRQSLSFFDRQKVGEIVSRVNRDARALSQTVRIFTALVQTPLTTLGMLVAVLVLNWKLALIGMIGYPLAVWPTVVMGRRIRRLSRRRRQVAADRTSAMVQVFGATKVVKSLRREGEEADRFVERNNDLFRLQMKGVRVGAAMGALVAILYGLGIGAAVAVGGYVIVTGVADFNPADLFAFLMALIGLSTPVRGLVGINAQIQAALPGAERLFELLDVHEGLPQPERPTEVEPLREAVRLRNVSFSYGRERVLDNVSIEVPAGRKVGIVGPSGTGKSTTIGLVCRFYDPDSGAVEADGVDLRQANLSSWLGQVGLVTQDPLLFNTTIRENILYGKPDAADGEIEAAARLADIHEDIMKLPDGYETTVGERGVRLSGGQRQRICLARALVGNPRVLLLDEATSSLDSASERVVQEAIDRAGEGRTVVTVAHRLSTVRNADRIYVIVKGRVESWGTHEELIERSPVYRELWEMQSAAPVR